ncbi:MAG: DNA polymerase IV [Chloroflexi bacterium]|jgi:DNA polymerase-4|nr:DNA polymerase IV [Chloroflexota bacterium]
MTAAITAQPERWIVHVDLDAFFASVEEFLNSSLRGKPIVVGGTPQGRGVVASASYAARAFGVRSAMPVAQALRLCPHLVIVRGHYDRYGEFSDQIMQILDEFTPVMEQVSIDEAFLDITGCERLWGTPRQTAERIRTRVASEVGLPISLGVASTKLVAKIACSQGKPNGLVMVPRNEEARYLAPLSVQELWGVGKVTAAKLQAQGIHKIGDLQRLDQNELTARFGDAGAWLYRSSLGIDSSSVSPDRERRSVSHETTFAQDVAEREPLRRTILEMSDHLARQLRERRLVGGTVRLKLRTADFDTFTRQRALEQPTDRAEVINSAAAQLLDSNWAPGTRLRLIGVGVSGLLDGAGYQLGLFDDSDQRAIRLANALDEIHKRFGSRAITRASLLRRRRDEPDEPLGD